MKTLNGESKKQEYQANRKENTMNRALLDDGRHLQDNESLVSHTTVQGKEVKRISQPWQYS